MASTGSSSETTQNHDKIRNWIEERGGRPPLSKHGKQGRRCWPAARKFDESEENLEDVEWDEFFDTFDDSHLTFLFQANFEGNQSRFFKFIRQ